MSWCQLGKWQSMHFRPRMNQRGWRISPFESYGGSVCLDGLLGRTQDFPLCATGIIGRGVRLGCVQVIILHFRERSPVVRCSWSPSGSCCRHPGRGRDGTKVKAVGWGRANNHKTEWGPEINRMWLPEFGREHRRKWSEWVWGEQLRTACVDWVCGLNFELRWGHTEWSPEVCTDRPLVPLGSWIWRPALWSGSRGRVMWHAEKRSRNIVLDMSPVEGLDRKWPERRQACAVVLCIDGSL